MDDEVLERVASVLKYFLPTSEPVVVAAALHAAGLLKAEPPACTSVSTVSGSRCRLRSHDRKTPHETSDGHCWVDARSWS